ncbi:hypothetical protein MesoLj113a_25530 [Mesorhizobium sp. 113-1-2]|nr:hypothetical protein MesoLj113a_25530 [Mesorhizobium sp. 113-1-2]
MGRTEIAGQAQLPGLPGQIRNIIRHTGLTATDLCQYAPVLAWDVACRQGGPAPAADHAFVNTA